MEGKRGCWRRACCVCGAVGEHPVLFLQVYNPFCFLLYGKFRSENAQSRQSFAATKVGLGDPKYVLYHHNACRIQRFSFLCSYFLVSFSSLVFQVIRFFSFRLLCRLIRFTTPLSFDFHLFVKLLLFRTSCECMVCLYFKT